MPMSTDTQASSAGIINHKTGYAVTTAATAAAATFTLGFTPRIVRFHNVTDRISDEWLTGMAAASSIHTVATGTRTLEATNGITVGTDGTFTVTAVTMVASKTFVWEAIG